jgi:hypothetical protein
MQAPIKYNKGLKILLGCILLYGCTGELRVNHFSSINKSSTAVAVDVPEIPSNWKYFDCPQIDFCGTLRFPLPKESEGLDIQSHDADGGYYPMSRAYFNIAQTNTTYTLDETAACVDLDKNPEDCSRKKIFILNLHSYSILKFAAHKLGENPSDYDLVLYVIKTKDREFFVRAHIKDSEGEKALDTTMLNLKFDSESYNSSK